MELIIKPLSKTNQERQHLKMLKEYLEQKTNKKTTEIGYKKQKTKDGEMGGFTDSILAIIKTSSEPIVALISVLQEYVKLFKTEIEVKNGDKSIIIRSKNPEELTALVDTLIEKLK